MAEIGALLPIESQPLRVERITDRNVEQVVHCTPLNVATEKTKGSEVRSLSDW